MASIKLTGDTSGEITISAPAVAGTNTLTLPADTGTLTTTDVATNRPMFSAYRSSTITLVDNVATKITFDAVDFDTDSAFDETTNHRFTVPSGKGGKYQINATARMDALTSNNLGQSKLFIYKNGSLQFQVYKLYNTNYSRADSAVINHVLDLSAGDYIEIYVLCNTVDNANATMNGTDLYSHFSMYRLIG